MHPEREEQDAVCTGTHHDDTQNTNGLGLGLGLREKTHRLRRDGH